MAKQNIEAMLEKRVNKLREEEKSKKEDLIQIQKERRRFETALESLKKDIPVRKRRGKDENGLLSYGEFRDRGSQLLTPA